jgi:hypothetical protein
VKLESREMQRAIEKELQDGEEIVWCAQPRPEALGRHLGRLRFIAYIFYVVGGLSAMFFGTVFVLVALNVTPPPVPGPNSRNAGVAAPIWVLALLPLFGLAFVAGGRVIWRLPLRAGKAAAFSAYALTTSRLLILDSDAKGVNRTVRRFGVADVERIVRIERPNDEGDLILGEVKEEEFISGGGTGGPLMRPIGLMGVDRPDQVERLIRETLVAAKRGSD